jgi:aminoglycoside phosphotransferase (APT) family kinase protein
MNLLHGDPGTHNICVSVTSESVVSLLDWEDALIGDPLFDLAAAASFQPARRLPQLLFGYGLDQPGVHEQRLFALYSLRIALSKSVHRLRFGIVDEPNRTPGHHRILRGVEELTRLF